MFKRISLVAVKMNSRNVERQIKGAKEWRLVGIPEIVDIAKSYYGLDENSRIVFSIGDFIYSDTISIQWAHPLYEECYESYIDLVAISKNNGVYVMPDNPEIKFIDFWSKYLDERGVPLCPSNININNDGLIVATEKKLGLECIGYINEPVEGANEFYLVMA